jgi:hypothetical protein
MIAPEHQGDELKILCVNCSSTDIVQRTQNIYYCFDCWLEAPINSDLWQQI